MSFAASLDSLGGLDNIIAIVRLNRGSSIGQRRRSIRSSSTNSSSVVVGGCGSNIIAGIDNLGKSRLGLGGRQRRLVSWRNERNRRVRVGGGGRGGGGLGKRRQLHGTRSTGTRGGSSSRGGVFLLVHNSGQVVNRVGGGVVSCGDASGRGGEALRTNERPIDRRTAWRKFTQCCRFRFWRSRWRACCREKVWYGSSCCCCCCCWWWWKWCDICFLFSHTHFLRFACRVARCTTRHRCKNQNGFFFLFFFFCFTNSVWTGELLSQINLSLFLICLVLLVVVLYVIFALLNSPLPSKPPLFLSFCAMLSISNHLGSL